MSAIWVADAQSRIYTIVTTRARKNLIDAYPKLIFTKDAESDSEPLFPTVYIHFLPFNEVGSDLQGTSINGVLMGVQVDVTVSKTQGQITAQKVAYEVLEQFKKLGFQMPSGGSPEFVKTGSTDTKQMSFRCRRVVGASDTIK